MMCLAATAAGFVATKRGRDVARARHRRGGRWVVVAVTLGVLAVVTAGTAFAAYQYDASTSDRILPGGSVGGVERDEAVRTLRELAEPTLYSELVVEAAGHSWNITPASLGMTANVEGAVARALAVADDLSLTARVYHRLRDVPVDVSLDLVFDEHRREVKAFVQQAFDEVVLPAIDARFALVD